MSSPVVLLQDAEKAANTTCAPVSDQDIPVAAAIPIAPAGFDGNGQAGPSSSSYTMVDIPVGSAGFRLTGVPVRLGEALDKNVKLPAGVEPGVYVHSIQILPDLEITHLTNAETANQILKSNAHLGRRLGVGRDPPILLENDGFYYTHFLPTPASLEALQIKLDGFPPRITIVSDKSPMAGKMYARQAVHELRIPGKPTLNALTPGFTAYRVEQELNAASNIAGIRLTVKDELKVIKKEKGSNKAFDDCVVM